MFIKLNLLVLPWSKTEGKISSIPLPPSLYKCFDKLTHSKDTKNLAAENICSTCILKYLWNDIGVKCQDTPSTTLRYIGRLMAPLVKHREKRQATKRHPLPVRREYRMMTDTEREDYHLAILMLKNDTDIPPNAYDAIAMFHQGSVRQSAHGGPNFLGWHRIFLLIYENALKEKVPSVTLPYWDSTLDFHMDYPLRSIMWHSTFLGNGDGAVTSGSFADWDTPMGQLTRNIGFNGQLISNAEVQAILSLKTTRRMATLLEIIHNEVHVWVSGHMLRVDSAAMDPIFYMHHAFIDYIWWEFQRKVGGKEAWRYPKTNIRKHKANAFMEFHSLEGFKPLRNKDGYKKVWTKDFYTYDPAPACSWWAPSCRSKYLQCVLWDWPAYCVSLEAPPEYNLIQERTARSLDENIVEVIRKPRSVNISGLPLTDIQTKHEKQLLNTGDTEIKNQQFKNSSLENDSANKPEDLQRHIRDANFENHALSHQEFDTPTPKLPFTSTTANEQLISKGKLGQSTGNHIFHFPHEHPKSSCLGNSVQNLFLVNCISDIDLWGFLPVQVVHLRENGPTYRSNFVKNGKIDPKSDIYDEKNYPMLNKYIKPQNPNTNERCPSENSGVFKVTITSYGLNYLGWYEDYIFMDNRHPIASAVGYIAVKKPEPNETEVYITAFDHCGRICRPQCLVHNSDPPIYNSCSGALKVNNKHPKMYDNTYGAAVLNLWEFHQGASCPTTKREQIFLTFYCDYVTHWWPWKGYK